MIKSKFVWLLVGSSYLAGCSGSGDQNATTTAPESVFSEVAKLTEPLLPPVAQSSSTPVETSHGEGSETPQSVEESVPPLICPAPRKTLPQAESVAQRWANTPDGPVSAEFAGAIERRKQQLLYIPDPQTAPREVIDAYHGNLREIYSKINELNLVDGFNRNPVYVRVTNDPKALAARRLWPLADRINPDRDAPNVPTNVEARHQYTSLMYLVQAFLMPVTDGVLPEGQKSYYNDPDVLEIIKIALTYINANSFGVNSFDFRNWYQNEIGNPRLLMTITYLMLGEGKDLYKYLDKDIVTQAIKAIEFWAPNPTKRLSSGVTETGANLADKAHTDLMLNLLTGNREKITRAAHLLSNDKDVAHEPPPLLKFIPTSTNKTGDGFYDDGGFIQHTYYSYLGNYGKDLVYDVGSAVDVLAGTEFDISGKSGMSNFIQMVHRTIDSQIYRGGLSRTANGRSIGRQDWTDHVRARWLASSVASFVEGASRSPSLTAERQQELDGVKALIKKWVSEGSVFQYGLKEGAPPVSGPAAYLQGIIDPVTQNTLSTESARLLWDIWADECISPAKSYSHITSMPSIARVFARVVGQFNFGADIAMFSPSIRALTSINNQNAMGWWLSMGALYLHTDDQTQFDGDYQATMDLRRIPGTTTDRSGVYNTTDATPNLRTTETSNQSEFNGSSILAKRNADDPNEAAVASVGLSFSTKNVTEPSSNASNYKRLAGNKSWFLLGDKIVALGSFIREGNASVETIIENRKLSTPSTQPIVTYGSDGGGAKSLTPTMGKAEDLPVSQWLNFSDPNFATSPIGYLFLAGSPKVTTLLEDREGSWNDIDKGETTFGNNVKKRNRFFSVAYQHGTGLTDTNSGSYGYVILPGRSAQQTEEANSQLRDDLKILRNDRSASVIADQSLGVIGANIWSRTDAVTQAVGSVKVNGPDGNLLIDANGMMSFTLRKEDDKYVRVAITEPTRNVNQINVTLHVGARCTISADKDIAIAYGDDGAVKMTVNTSDRRGLSKEVLLRLNTPGQAAGGTFATANTLSDTCD